MSHFNSEDLLNLLPNNIKVVQDILEINVISAAIYNSKRSSIHLKGLGQFPIINLTRPKQIEDSPGPPTLTFDRTMVGCKSEEHLRFKNVSDVQCRVIMEILENGDNSFIFQPDEKTVNANLARQPNDKEIGSSTVVLLEPKNEASFRVYFIPLISIHCQCTVKLHVVNNPYDLLELKLQGESYIDDITICGLTCSVTQELEGKSRKIVYNLLFDTVQVGFGCLERFNLLNNTTTEIFKYEWPTLPNIEFFPSEGHLSPQKKQTIYVLFHSKEPVTLTEEEIVCSVNNISYPPKSLCTVKVNWTRDKMLCHWLSHQEKHIPRFEKVWELKDSESTEPDYDVLYSSKEIALLVTAKSDTSVLLCNRKSIRFPETLICQFHEETITLENASCVPSQFIWLIESVSQDAHTNTLALGCSIGPLDVNSRFPTTNKCEAKPVRPSTAPKLSWLQSAHGNEARARPRTSHCQPFGDICDEKEQAVSFEDYLKGHDESEECPFTILPQQGYVRPMSTMECKIIFAPKQILHFQGIAKCLSQDVSSPIKVLISGYGQMSSCHIEAEESNYLTSGRRLLVSSGEHFCYDSFPQNTKVVEVKTLGVGVSYIKRLNLINPTEEMYNFFWEYTPKHSEPEPVFSCHKLSGNIQSHKLVEVEFYFLPEKPGIYESLWTLKIPKMFIDQPILLVGTADLPRLRFTTNHVSLPQTLIGAKTFGSFTLINEEDIDLTYCIEEESMYSPGARERLMIEPQRGKIDAQGVVKFRLEYEPKVAGENYYQVKCQALGMSEPLELNVSTRCYQVQPYVLYELGGNIKRELVPTLVNHIDLGILLLRMPYSLIFHISNIGKPSFHYEWELDKQLCNKKKINIECSTKKGLVTSQSRVSIKMVITPLEKTSFSDTLALLKISKGPEYQVTLTGSSLFPDFKFSFNNYNFGPCLIQTTNKRFNKVNLSFTNLDEKPMLIEKVSTDSDFLHVGLKGALVQPRLEKKITLCFMPGKLMSYSETVEFVINGSYTVPINVTGEGVDFKVSLVDPAQKWIDMGAVLVKQKKSQYVEINNASKAPAILQVQLKLGKNSKKYLQLEPSSFKLMPMKTIRIKVIYAPKERKQSFTEKVYLICQDIEQPLFTIKGSCIGTELSLSRNSLPFGVIVIGCTKKEKITLMNSGDIGVRFVWKIQGPPGYFTIVPTEGYSIPGSETVFDVTFEPTKESEWSKNEMWCCIENYENLVVELSGWCEKMSKPSQYLPFLANARRSSNKEITIFNGTNDPWLVKPVLSGDYFSGREIVHIPPYSSTLYSITYTPTVVSHANNKHVGNLFLPLPDGTGMTYGLVGVSDFPLPEDLVEWECPCKTNFVGKLMLSNWLPKTQRFRATIETEDGTKLDLGLIITGNEYVEVPPEIKRFYHVEVYSYKTRNVSFRVTFTNEKTREYMYFLINLKITDSNTVGKILLTTKVRVPKIQKVPLRNPLDKVVRFSFSSDRDDIKALNCPLEIQPHKQNEMVIQYLPLLPMERSIWRITFSCEELGSYPYDAIIEACTPDEEKKIEMKVLIGKIKERFLPIVNYLRQETEFVVQATDDFIIEEREFTVQAGETKMLKLAFEPSSLETKTDSITVTSFEAGTFIFPVVGIPLPPKAVGPLVLFSGNILKIAFKNIFDEKTVFKCSCEHDMFLISKPLITLLPKQEMDVELEMLQPEEQQTLVKKLPPIGTKMTIQPVEGIAEESRQVQWTYYIHGVIVKEPRQ